MQASQAASCILQADETIIVALPLPEVDECRTVGVHPQTGGAGSNSRLHRSLQSGQLRRQG